MIDIVDPTLFGLIKSAWSIIHFQTLMFVVSFSPRVQFYFAFTYVVLKSLQPLFLLMAGIYLLNKLVGATNKKISDPTNVDIFDRALALVGLIVPYVELCRIFSRPLKDYPWLLSFNRDYLAGIKMAMLYSPYTMMIWNLVVFREFIRRRGPDTVWFGSDRKKLWIKWFVRYYWCFGFCLASLEEPYNFFKTKVVDLLRLPSIYVDIMHETVCVVCGSLLIYNVICILIGIPSRLPLFHGACEFHVGKPKKN
jgi:hypothetical protein